MSGWLVASLGAFLLGCGLFPSRWRWLRVPILLLGLLLAVVSAAHLVADRFTGQGIDEAVIYHLLVGLEGAGFTEYWDVMALAAALLLISLGFSWGCWQLLRRSAQRRGHWMAMPAVLLLASAWIVNPGGKALVKTGIHYTRASTPAPLPAGYVRPALPQLVEGVDKPKNLVLIYAESLERTYFDADVFPGLLPRLGRRQGQGLNFTGIDQLPGMAWTIAGVVGSQCGVPLVPGWAEQTEEANQQDFLPLATCLGDVLAGAGYSLHYLGGAKSEFAGKGSFYQTHGYQRVEGVDALLPRQADPEYRNAWGLYDDALLPRVAERFDTLAEQDAPFVLTTLTLDTHHPSGHVSASCEHTPYGDGDNAILQAVHCSDRLVDELIAHIQASPHADDTVIAVVSDHVAMRNTASERLEAHSRRNLFMVLDSDMAPREISRSGSHMDIAPTLLPLLGWDVDALGFGRDLLGVAPTFHEQHHGSHAAVRALYPGLGGLWTSYPDLRHGLRVDIARRELIIGAQRIGYPALLQVDAQGKRVLGVVRDLDIRHALANLGDEAAFLWVDACHRNALLADTEALCLVSRAPGESAIRRRSLDDQGLVRIARDALWDPAVGQALPSQEQWLARLRDGGGVRGVDEDDRQVREAVPNPGMQFVRWRGVRGPEQFSARLPEGERGAEAVFDQAVPEPDGLAPWQAHFRSAWVGAARVGQGALLERLAPADSPRSVARAALWQPGIGSLDLRGFGGFKMARPRAFLRHDDTALIRVSRGLNLVVLSPDGEVVAAESYDTHGDPAQSDALARRLQSLPEGLLVMLASADEFTQAATGNLQQALDELGFALRLPLAERY